MSFEPLSNRRRPVIGCTTYRKLSHDTAVPLYGLMTSYIEAVRLAGGIPVLIPLNLTEEELTPLLERFDGLLLPGGGDIDPLLYNGRTHPTVAGVDADRDRVEMFVARYAIAQEKPLLAICRGQQVLNVALGGTLWEDIESQVSGTIRHDYNLAYPRNFLPHTVDITPESVLARALGRTQTPVNSLHHQAVRDIAAQLTVTAVAPDGIIEGMEVSGHPFAVGVQWHPENLIHDDPAMLALFKALVTASNG